MIYRTIAARDNITISADVDAHDYINEVADIVNQEMENKKEVYVQAMTDYVLFGHCEVVI